MSASMHEEPFTENEPVEEPLMFDSEFFDFTRGKPEAERYELIEGRIVAMAAPSLDHQDLVLFLGSLLREHFKGKTCKPYIAPTDVRLSEHNVFQPDVLVVCDPSKRRGNHIYGAPDFVIEVISLSTHSRDYLEKSVAYMRRGVKEYWIVDWERKQLTIYSSPEVGSEQTLDVAHVTLPAAVAPKLFPDCLIDFNEAGL